jgi:hypothetical protein
MNADLCVDDEIRMSDVHDVLAGFTDPGFHINLYAPHGTFLLSNSEHLVPEPEDAADLMARL